MRYQDGPYKKCGILKAGVSCEVLIPQHLVACAECASDLLRELERLADAPTQNVERTQRAS